MEYRIFYFAVLCGVMIFPSLSHAYVGPGAGLSMLGSLVAIVVGVFIALVGLVVYPLKILKKKMQAKNAEDQNKSE